VERKARQLDHVDQSLWKMTRRVMRVPILSPPLVTLSGTPLSLPEKAEALVDRLESQFQSKNDPSDPAVIDNDIPVPSRHVELPCMLTTRPL
jgi:hypothetical protein